MDVGRAALAFTVTVFECGIGVLASRAFNALDFWRGVGWGVCFEALLCADMNFIADDRSLIGPILLGSAVGIGGTILLLKRAVR